MISGNILAEVLLYVAQAIDRVQYHELTQGWEDEDPH